MVAEEVERMMARLKVAEVTPTIVGLQEQLEQIRAGEIDKVRRKFGPFTPEQEQAMEMLTRGIINKIAHGPISELRNHAGAIPKARTWWPPSERRFISRTDSCSSSHRAVRSSRCGRPVG